MCLVYIMVISVSSNWIIRDQNFRHYLHFRFGDELETEDVEEIECSGWQKYENGIKSLEGIEYFTNLRVLKCNDCNLSSLDLYSNRKLEYLECRLNANLTTININSCINLLDFDCQLCNLSYLDISQNTKLQTLNCGGNHLEELDLSNNSSLTYISCAQNRLKQLDVSNTNIGHAYMFHHYDPLWCSRNPPLTTLYIKYGWNINGINVNRGKDHIDDSTKIAYK